tara:strand:+ start:88 stop:519 length:432 start_codon:yes stop_codon:yes gene_type:complete
MKKRYVFVFLLLFLLGCQESVNTVCFEETCFDVMLALTDDERALGLMYREQMDSDSGMLFVYHEEDIRRFWMKNTKINLDLIWLDASGEVVHIEHDVQPCVENCSIYMGEGQYVLEINGGLANSLGMTEGSLLTLPTSFQSEE